MIDLSSNENPYLPPEKVLGAAHSALAQMNRYASQDEISLLRKAISDYTGAEEKRILIGPGTDYLFEKVVCRFARGRSVLVLNPSFLQSLESVGFCGGKILRLQLTPPCFQVDWSGIQCGPCLIFLDSPNNPTGQCLISRAQLEGLLWQRDHLVVVDEAAYEYCGKTFADLVVKHSNLAVIRTLDKAFGLAGLRVSWIIAGDAILNGLNMTEIRINRPACAAAAAALKDTSYGIKNAAMTVLERKRLENELGKRGVEVFPSEANFLLVRTTFPDFVLRLKEMGILVADLSSTWLSGFCRISLGSREEIDALLRAMDTL